MVQSFDSEYNKHITYMYWGSPPKLSLNPVRISQIMISLFSAAFLLSKKISSYLYPLAISNE